MAEKDSTRPEEPRTIELFEREWHGIEGCLMAFFAALQSGLEDDNEELIRAVWFGYQRLCATPGIVFFRPNKTRSLSSEGSVQLPLISSLLQCSSDAPSNSLLLSSSQAESRCHLSRAFPHSAQLFPEGHRALLWRADETSQPSHGA